MTMQDIISAMMSDADKYATEQDVEVFVGMKPVRTHKKKRIAKKWAKRYGYKAAYETKRAKVIDVTMDMVIDYCQENHIPVTDLSLSF